MISISQNEQKEIVLQIKQHFGVHSFTYEDTKKLFPLIDKRRLFRVLQKASYNGYLQKVGTIYATIGKHYGYVKQYQVVLR
jgi:hypothetical protein